MPLGWMGSDIMSHASWAFLPNFLSQYLQSAYYSIFFPAGKPRPQPGSQEYAQHRLYCRILIVTGCLLYTIYEADSLVRTDSNYYALLGLSPQATEREINQRYRRLALEFHPDKVAQSDHNTRLYAQTVFPLIQKARDTLINPLHRFAYDRFGPDILNCRNCHSVGDYMYEGISALVPGHIGSILFILFSNMLGYLTPGTYWRYLTILSLVTFEIYVLLHPTLPFLSSLNAFLVASPIPLHPPLLPFQVLRLARRIAITIYLALTQLQPLLEQLGVGGIAVLGGSNGKVNPNLSAAVRSHSIKIGALLSILNDEVRKDMAAALDPYIDTGRNGDDGYNSCDSSRSVPSRRAKKRGLEKVREKIADAIVDEEMGRRVQQRRQNMASGRVDEL